MCRAAKQHDFEQAFHERVEDVLKHTTQLADYYINHHNARRRPNFLEKSAENLPHIGIRVDVSGDRAVAFIQDIVIPFQLAKVRENQVILKAFSEFVTKFSLLGPGREESAGSFQPSRWLLECLVPGSSMFKGNGEFYVKALSEASSLDDVITKDNKLLFHQVPTPYIMAAFCFIEDLEGQLEAVAKYGEEDFERATTRADCYFQNNNSNANPLPLPLPLPLPNPVTHETTGEVHSEQPQQLPTPPNPAFTSQEDPIPSPNSQGPDPAPNALPPRPSPEPHSPAAPTNTAPSTPPTLEFASMQTSAPEGTIAPTAQNQIPSVEAVRKDDENKDGNGDDDDDNNNISEEEIPEFPGKHNFFSISYIRFYCCIVGFIVV